MTLSPNETSFAFPPNPELATQAEARRQALLNNYARLDIVQFLHQRDMLTKVVESYFLFCVIWGLGGGLDAQSRQKFDKFFREKTRDSSRYRLTIQLPAAGSSFDFYFDEAHGRWASWAGLLSSNVEFPVSLEASYHSYHDLYVPSSDTIRYQHTTQLLMQRAHPTLLVGPTGHGKTALARHLLNYFGVKPNVQNANIAASYFDTMISKPEQNSNISMFGTPITLEFSPSIKTYQVQQMIDSKLVRRKDNRSPSFALPKGKRCVVLVDDLNLPQGDEFNAQPPLELLRQLIDQQGWYAGRANPTFSGDQAATQTQSLQSSIVPGDKLSFRRIAGLQLLATMGIQRPGTVAVSQRLLRHFSQVSVIADDAAVARVYTSILNWHFSRGPAYIPLLGVAVGLI